MDEALENVKTTPTYMSEFKKFINSTNPVDISVFFFITLVIMVIILQVIIYIMSEVNTPSDSPILIDGIMSGDDTKIIRQNPAINGAIPIKRSTDDNGISFTWSVWLKLKNDTGIAGYKSIFYKGEQNISTGNINNPNNSPGLYVKGGTNTLAIIMNTNNPDNYYDEIEIPNIPMNKWFNIVIRLSGQYNLDIYINGRLAKRHLLSGIPIQNYGDVHLDGDFDGLLSSLRYYSYSLNNIEIMEMVNEGPNFKLVGESQYNKSIEDGQQYLALQWFLSNNNNV
jgi:hypothetical protein